MPGGDDLLDFTAAASRAGLAIADLTSLVVRGDIVAVDGRISATIVAAWIARDREARRRALVAFAAGVGEEVFY